MNAMKKCPHCGAELTASLVDAVANPSREESCPKAPRTETQDDGGLDAARNRLASLMMLRRLFDSTSRGAS